MRCWPLIAVVGAAASLTAPASAQHVADLPAAQPGQTIERPGLGGGRSVDVFQVKGAVGSRLTADVSGEGAFTATLYSPEGVAMLSARGEGGLRLIAFLPLDATYRLSVLREDSTRPFRLALSSEAAPDLMTANARYAVGYETDNPATKSRVWRCWSEPGVSVRSFGVSPEITTTDLGGGVSRTDYLDEGQAKAIITRRRMEDDEIVFATEGLRETYRAKPFRPLVNMAFKGYACQPPPAITPAPLTPIAPPPAATQVAKAPPAPNPQTAKRAPLPPPFAPPVFVK